MPHKIFISYRRGDVDVPNAAARIRHRLTGAMGAGAVFIDVDNLRPGGALRGPHSSAAKHAVGGCMDYYVRMVAGGRIRRVCGT